MVTQRRAAPDITLVREYQPDTARMVAALVWLLTRTASATGNTAAVKAADEEGLDGHTTRLHARAA